MFTAYINSVARPSFFHPNLFTLSSQIGIMQLTTLFVALLPLVAAAPACPPSSSSAAPSPTTPTNPAVSYTGRRLLFSGSLQKCMIAKGNWDGATVGL